MDEPEYIRLVRETEICRNCKNIVIGKENEGANCILNFLYGSLKEDDLFLKRKYEKFFEAKDFFKEEDSKLISRKAFKLKNNFKKDPKEMILSFLSKDNLIPREIALRLGVSLSTLYRWMDKYKIRKFVLRGSSEWSQRIIKSKIRSENEPSTIIERT